MVLTNSTSIPPVINPWKDIVNYISRATQEGSLAFPIFIRFISPRTSSTSILLTAPSTLLVSMLSLYSFSITFYKCSLQIFFRLSTLTFTAPLSSLKQLNQTKSLFFPALCLAILNNLQLSQHQSTFSTTSQDLWSIAIYTTLLASFFPHNISSYLPHSKKQSKVSKKHYFFTCRNLPRFLQMKYTLANKFLKLFFELALTWVIFKILSF